MGHVFRVVGRLKRLIAAALPTVGGRRRRRFAPSRPIVRLMAGGAALTFLVVGTTALILSNLRHHTVAESQQQLMATATVVAQLASRDFQALDLLEANLIEQMESAAIVSDELYASAMSGHDVHLMLRDKINDFPCLEAVTLIGVDGKLINSSQTWPVPPDDVAATSYFKTLKANPQMTTTLSEPVFDRSSGGWRIYLARKFIGSNGEFIGLVVGAIRLQYFEEFYQTLTRGPDDSVGLFNSDGLMLAHYPHNEAVIGKPFVNRPFHDKVLSSSEQGLAQTTVGFDGRQRLVAQGDQRTDVAGGDLRGDVDAIERDGAEAARRPRTVAGRRRDVRCRRIA